MEITSYPPIDEIVTNNVTYPTDGNSLFSSLLFMLMLWFSILCHVYACFYVQNCAFSTSNPKEYIYYIITLYINPYKQLIAWILLSWICVAVCVHSFRFTLQEVLFNFRGTRKAWIWICNTGCNWSVNSHHYHHYHLVRFPRYLYNWIDSECNVLLNWVKSNFIVQRILPNDN